MPSDPKNPPSFKDALVDAAQAIAGGVGSADYDAVFAAHMQTAIGQWIKQGGPKQPAPAGGGAPGGPSAGGAPGQPVPDGSAPTPSTSSPGPTGDTGSAPPGGGAQTPPSAPTPGGMTQGLTPSPDEMRRVLSDVAGS